jgi:probable rRNA maturation factor
LVIVHSKLQGVSTKSLGQFVVQAQRAAGVVGEVDVLITSSAQVRRLNRRFRGKNKATDVLSFPSAGGKIHHGGTETRRHSFSKTSVAPGLRARCLPAGDIAISAEVGARNARRLGHSLAEELKLLILHGLLHLAGYDHESDSGDMARQEARLRSAFGLPSTLIERTTCSAEVKRRASGMHGVRSRRAP